MSRWLFRERRVCWWCRASFVARHKAIVYCTVNCGANHRRELALVRRVRGSLRWCA